MFLLQWNNNRFCSVFLSRPFCSVSLCFRFLLCVVFCLSFTLDLVRCHLWRDQWLIKYNNLRAPSLIYRGIYKWKECDQTRACSKVVICLQSLTNRRTGRTLLPWNLNWMRRRNRSHKFDRIAFSPRHNNWINAILFLAFKWFFFSKN